VASSESNLTIKVGIFIVAAVILAVGFSLRIQEERIGRATYALDAYFEEALGLEPGADVSLRGVRIGKVEALRFDPERRAVVAELRISSEYRLPDGSVAFVERSPLLGTSTVVVEWGEGPTMIPDDGEVATRQLASFNELVQAVTDVSTDAKQMITSVSEASDEVKNLVESFNEGQGKLLEDLQTVIEENREDLRTTSETFAKVGPKLEELADRLNEVTASLSEGEGTIGKLYKDESLYDDLKAFSADMRSFMDEFRNADGTLSKLINDDSLAVKAEESFDKLGKAGDEIQTLLADKRTDIDKMIEAMSDVGPQMQEAVADLREISEKINSGEGTLGKLVNDPSLYDDAQTTVNRVGESFENSEEQGIIRSFIGTIFGIVI